MSSTAPSLPAVSDFWPSCGFTLLDRTRDGRLVVTDDYLRRYYMRQEIAPIADSCAVERGLHASLMEQPRREVAEVEIAAIRDEDARENYRVLLRFREKLLAAPTLEAFYSDLFRHGIAVPPDFIHHTVQVILRAILEGCENALEVRAAEIFFRKQRVSVNGGSIMLADEETVEMQAAQAIPGAIGQLIREAQGAPRVLELDVLDEKNSAEYWARDERFDTVLNLDYERGGCRALCRLLERWVAHFHGTAVSIEPIREIPDEEWKWHVGLDAEATAMLNDIFNGGTVEEERMKRIIGLYRARFSDPAVLRPELAGAPVFLALAMAPDGSLRAKPQNLLVNLPLATPV